jgi:hypothetical protein
VWSFVFFFALEKPLKVVVVLYTTYFFCATLNTVRNFIRLFLTSYFFIRGSYLYLYSLCIATVHSRVLCVSQRYPVIITERERKTERLIDTERHRDTETQRQRKTERQKDIETEYSVYPKGILVSGYYHREREKDRETDRHRETQRHRDKERQRDRKT